MPVLRFRAADCAGQRLWRHSDFRTSGCGVRAERRCVVRAQHVRVERQPSPRGIASARCRSQSRLSDWCNPESSRLSQRSLYRSVGFGPIQCAGSAPRADPRADRLDRRCASVSRKSPQVVVVGDALLDHDVSGRIARMSPEGAIPILDVEQECFLPGGAALAASFAVDAGADVTLIAGIDDASSDASEHIQRILKARSIRFLPIRGTGSLPIKQRVVASGQQLVRIDRGCLVELSRDMAAARGCLARADAILCSDYGGPVLRQPELRAELELLASRVPVVWDPHAQGALPVAHCSVVTPNASEVLALSAQQGRISIRAAASELRAAWRAGSVCVTLGAEGALLVVENETSVPTTRGTGDPRGAGDCFAAALAVQLACRSDLADAVAVAVRRASVQITTAPPQAAPLQTLVAVGGCFDLLHPGHVRLLQAARAFGDRLVVMLNSDESVKRLKGSDRPVQPVQDRRELLLALGCVDDVVVFEEDNPSTALARLRPDIWVKGGDYREEDLPEAPLVRSWGGRVAVLPFYAGFSTTLMLQRASETCG